MADLSVTLTESLILNGIDHGGAKTVNIGACTEVYKRNVTCTNGQTTIIARFDEDVEDTANGINLEGTKYIRITNLDGSNFITLNITIDLNENFSAADAVTSIKVAAGQSFIMGTGHDSISCNDDDATVAALADVREITVTPDSGAIVVEVFVAGVIA
jgi:hypothetical protein